MLSLAFTFSEPGSSPASEAGLFIARMVASRRDVAGVRLAVTCPRADLRADRQARDPILDLVFFPGNGAGALATKRHRPGKGSVLDPAVDRAAFQADTAFDFGKAEKVCRHN